MATRFYISEAGNWHRRALLFSGIQRQTHQQHGATRFWVVKKISRILKSK